MGRLNKSALADVTLIDRNRLGRILGGTQVPEAFQLAALMRAAGADEQERAAWEMRRVAALGVTGASAGVVGGPGRVAGSRTENGSGTASALAADDYEVDRLFMVNTWGASAPLTPEHSVVAQVGGTDTDNLGSALRDRWGSVHGRVPAGSVGVVSRVSDPDWHETDEQVDYRIEVRRAPYSLTLAQRDLLADPEIFQRAAGLLNDYDMATFVSEFPGCKVAVNAQVATSDGYLVALRRSRLVHNYKAQWALSINETMQASKDPGEQEGLFDLTYRGLAEELHLQRDEVESVSVEWFGACLDCGDFYVFANVRTFLDHRALPDLQSQAHSRREHDSMALLDAAAVATTDFRGLGPDHKNRWLHHAPLAARLGARMLG